MLIQTPCTMALRSAASKLLLGSQRCAAVTASRAQGTAAAVPEGMPITAHRHMANSHIMHGSIVQMLPYYM